MLGGGGFVCDLIPISVIASHQPLSFRETQAHTKEDEEIKEERCVLLLLCCVERRLGPEREERNAMWRTKRRFEGRTVPHTVRVHATPVLVRSGKMYSSYSVLTL